jgi:hypothetical protein
MLEWCFEIFVTSAKLDILLNIWCFKKSFTITF